MRSTDAIMLAHWTEDHEVSASHQSFERLGSIRFPTHHDSRTYRLLTAEPDAPALLAAWMLLVQVAARLPRPLRGLLVDRDGRPCGSADLARMTGFSVPFFDRALAFFRSPSMGWLTPPPPGRLGDALQEVIAHRAAREQARRDRAIRRAEEQSARRLHRLASLSTTLNPELPRPAWAPTAADLGYVTASQPGDLRSPNFDLRTSLSATLDPQRPRPAWAPTASDLGYVSARQSRHSFSDGGPTAADLNYPDSARPFHPNPADPRSTTSIGQPRDPQDSSYLSPSSHSSPSADRRDPRSSPAAQSAPLSPDSCHRSPDPAAPSTSTSLLNSPPANGGSAPPHWRETLHRLHPPRTPAESHLYSLLLWPDLTPALQSQLIAHTPG